MQPQWGSCPGLSSTVTGSSGGGGGGSSKPTIIDITPEKIDVTYSGIKKDSKFVFNLNDEPHSLRITRIGTDYVEFILESEPIKFSLKVGESNIFNIGEEKLYVSLAGINKGAADVTLKKIAKQPVLLPSPVPKTEEPIKETPQQEKTVLEEQPKTVEPITQKNNNKILWSYLLVGLIVVLALSGLGYLGYNIHLHNAARNQFQQKTVYQQPQQQIITQRQPIFSQQTMTRKQNTLIDQAAASRLESYVKKMISEGYDPDKIREKILQVGWNKDIVDYVFMRIK
jgi:hypothetical protein